MEEVDEVATVEDVLGGADVDLPEPVLNRGVCIAAVLAFLDAI